MDLVKVNIFFSYLKIIGNSQAVFHNSKTLGFTVVCTGKIFYSVPKRCVYIYYSAGGGVAEAQPSMTHCDIISYKVTFLNFSSTCDFTMFCGGKTFIF